MSCIYFVYSYDLQKEMLGRMMHHSFTFSYSLLNGEWENFSVYHLILCAKYLFAYNNCNYITWFSKAEVITFIYLLEYV